MAFLRLGIGTIAFVSSPRSLLGEVPLKPQGLTTRPQAGPFPPRQRLGRHRVVPRLLQRQPSPRREGQRDTSLPWQSTQALERYLRLVTRNPALVGNRKAPSTSRVRDGAVTSSAQPCRQRLLRHRHRAGGVTIPGPTSRALLASAAPLRPSPTVTGPPLGPEASS